MTSRAVVNKGSSKSGGKHREPRRIRADDDPGDASPLLLPQSRNGRRTKHNYSSPEPTHRQHSPPARKNHGLDDPGDLPVWQLADNLQFSSAISSDSSRNSRRDSTSSHARSSKRHRSGPRSASSVTSSNKKSKKDT